MQKMMLEARAARDLAERTCEPQRSRTPGWAEERAIGTELAITLAAKNGHFYLDGATQTDSSKKNAVSAHVAVVGKHLARYSARPELPWVFGVIENDTPNSFNAPGGFVFVTTGLLKKLTNEAQLAGVLGHEISHVVGKDTLRLYVDAKFKQCVAAKYAAAIIKASGPTNPAIVETARYASEFDTETDLGTSDPSFRHFLLNAMMEIALMGSDKATEFAHDKAALELVSFAGYDASEYEKFLGGTAMPRHPEGAERTTRLQALREGELKDIAVGAAKPDLTKLLAPLSP